MLLNIKCVVIFSLQLYVIDFLILRLMQQDTINVHRLSCKYRLFLSEINKPFFIMTHFEKNSQIFKLIKIHPLRAVEYQRGGLWGSTPPPSPHPPKFRNFPKAEPNYQFRGVYLRNNVIRMWVSFICKLCGAPE
jgi:hypothetical protein